MQHIISKCWHQIPIALSPANCSRQLKRNIFCYFLGPLAGALTSVYGCKKVTVTGSILTAFGFILSIFATDVYYLYFSFGILGGELDLQVCLLFFAFFIFGQRLLITLALSLSICPSVSFSFSLPLSLFGHCYSISYLIFLILNSCFLSFNFCLFVLEQHPILSHYFIFTHSLTICILLCLITLYWFLFSFNFTMSFDVTVTSVVW